MRPYVTQSPSAWARPGFIRLAAAATFQVYTSLRLYGHSLARPGLHPPRLKYSQPFAASEVTFKLRAAYTRVTVRTPSQTRARFQVAAWDGPGSPRPARRGHHSPWPGRATAWPGPGHHSPSNCPGRVAAGHRWLALPGPGAAGHHSSCPEMLGTEVRPGRLDSSLRFIDIKSLCLEKPSALQPFASRVTN